MHSVVLKALHVPHTEMYRELNLAQGDLKLDAKQASKDGLCSPRFIRFPGLSSVTEKEGGREEGQAGSESVAPKWVGAPIPASGEEGGRSSLTSSGKNKSSALSI